MVGTLTPPEAYEKPLASICFSSISLEKDGLPFSGKTSGGRCLLAASALRQPAFSPSQGGFTLKPGFLFL